MMAGYFRLALVLCLAFVSAGIAFGQARPGGKADKQPNVKSDGTGKSSNRKAVGYYADAASLQNNGVFHLAVDEWKKLLKEYPNDPLASKAWHYLGICYMQLDTPDYEAAEKAFTEALKDEKLDVREESLVQLNWCLFSRARGEEQGSAKQVAMLQTARDRLTEFLKSYGDGTYGDQARFYLGEIEYALGARERAIGHYESMLKSKSQAKSSLRPDAQYALGVAYEEGQKLASAESTYREFLSEHKDHRLRGEVQMRLADVLIAQQKLDEAVQVLNGLAKGDDSMADYALLRLGYALSQQNKADEASQRLEEMVRRFPESKHLAAAQLLAGQTFFKAGRWDDAAKRFEELINDKSTRTADAAHWLAMTMMRQGKSKAASEMLEDALKWTKDSPLAVALQMDYADALYEQPEQIDKARKTYEQIVTDHPEDPLAPRAAYNAAFGALQLQQLESARKWSELFLSKYPNDPLRNEVAYVAAEALLQQGEHAASAEAYGKLIQADAKNPSRSMWVLRQAMANYLGGKYAVAIDSLNAAMSGFQDARQRAEGQFILGACYLLQERFDDAVEQFRASHKSNDVWSQADETLLMLAEAYLRKKDASSSKSTLEELLTKYPKSRLRGQVEYRLGQISAQAQQFDDAIARYRKLLTDENAKGFHSFSQYGIAWCLMQQDKYQEARKELEPLLVNNRKDAISQEAMLAEGICLRKIGKPTEAVAALEKFLETKPTAAALANGLYESAMAWVDARQSDKAQLAFERIVAEVPDYAAMDKVLYELAWLAEEKSDKTKAQKLFSDLVQRFPASDLVAESYYHIGQAQYEAEKYLESAKTYQVVLDKSKSDELSEKARYKLGWSYFQQEDFKQAAQQFEQQGKAYPNGKLAVDAYFMLAECSFRQDKFSDAIGAYEQAKKFLDAAGSKSAASDQVKSLIFLHCGQSYRELKQWNECEKWLREVINRYPNSPYLAIVTYELGFCAQNQGKVQEALKLYAEVANNYRNEVGARARFMMGEVYFSQRDFAKAIPEFQKVMYTYGEKEAPKDIKNWQAKSAFEAARCCEVLIENLKGEDRNKAVAEAQRCYKYILDRHPAHELSAQAQSRLGELVKLR